MEKFWMIVDVCGAEMQRGDDFRVLKFQAPRYCHSRKEKAEDELLRLAEKNPDREFVLVEAVAFAGNGQTSDLIYINQITQ